MSLLLLALEETTGRPVLFATILPVVRYMELDMGVDLDPIFADVGMTCRLCRRLLALLLLLLDCLSDMTKEETADPRSGVVCETLFELLKEEDEVDLTSTDLALFARKREDRVSRILKGDEFSLGVFEPCKLFDFPVFKL
jgi:hypothetical protein